MTLVLLVTAMKCRNAAMAFDSKSFGFKLRLVDGIHRENTLLILLNRFILWRRQVYRVRADSKDKDSFIDRDGDFRRDGCRLARRDPG
jgi:hypothetical protein